MVEIVYAGKNGGKTHHVYSRIEELISGGGEAVLIIPDQYSFESEKRMLELLGEKQAAKVEILGFSRLAEKLVPAQTGTAAGPAGKAACMSLAVDECVDRLKVYNDPRLKSADLIAEMLGMVLEFRQCRVTADDLTGAAAKTANPRLRDKLSDLAEIISAYDAILSRAFYDEADRMDLLARALDDSGFFRGKIVFIDGFAGFTEQEYEVLGRIFSQSERVCVTLCADDLTQSADEDARGFDRFAFTKKTASKLKSLARRCGDGRYTVKKADENPRRYSSDRLAHLEKYLYADSFEPFGGGEGEPVTVYSARDTEDECEFVALTIRRLLRQGFCRCRDIAVIARDEGSYSRSMRSALAKHGVPVFDDRRQPMLRQPLCVLVRAALETAELGFDTERVLALLKTGLAGLDAEETAILEDYTFTWSIDGKQWLGEWTRSPDGYTQTVVENDERLELLNSLRLRVTQPLVRLRDSIRSCSLGSDMIRCLYDYLVEINAAGNAKKYAARLVELGETAAAVEMEGVWAELTRAFDQLHAAFSSAKISVTRLREIFVIALSTQSIGLIPDGLDEVIVGAADRVRLTSPKVVFAVGVNEGVFPKTPAKGRILPDRERKELIDIGLNVNELSRFAFLQERFFVYNTLCAASDRLFITTSKRDFQGSAAVDSELIDMICSLLPDTVKLDRASLGFDSLIESGASVFDYYAEHCRDNDENTASALAYLTSEDAFSGKIAAIERAAARNGDFSLSPESARLLYGRDLFASATKVETYVQCGFRYFCRYGLGLHEHQKAEMDVRMRGTVIHFVLQKLLEEYDDSLAENPDEEIRALVFAVMNEFAADNVFGYELAGERESYLFNSLCETVCTVVLRLAHEMRSSDFRPTAFELKIGGADADVRAVELELSTGGKVIFTGSVDRVDLYTDEATGTVYLRVLDYKSGKKTFKLCDVANGLNMQMLLYLFAVCKNGKKLFGDTVPAGVLYVPGMVTSGSLSRDASEDDVKAAVLDDGRMNGIIIKNSRVVRAFDRTIDFDAEDDDDAKRYSGRVLAKSLPSMLIPPDKFELLDSYVSSRLKAIAEKILGGSVRAEPFFGGTYKRCPCDFCSFAPVCLRERGEEKGRYPDVDNSLGLAEIEARKEAGNDG